MSWSILDYDDEKAEKYRGFWNLSHKTSMYGDASDLVAFRLMPLSRRIPKAGRGRLVIPESSTWTGGWWRFKMYRTGRSRSWNWDFGDGAKSTEQHPVHTYEKPGEYVVTLYIDGPKGKAKRSKVWDVVIR